MRIIFLCKRRPQGRDLFSSPYGRFFFIPDLLSKKGHEVYLLLLSYKKESSRRVYREGMTWILESIYWGGPLKYIARANKLVRKVKPDWIIGFSDTYYGILAANLGQKYGICSLIDAYDNYESYIPWLKPLHFAWRKALSETTVVTAAGPHLGEYLAVFRPGKPVHIVPMAADPVGFRPMDKLESRRVLSLPLDKKIIGYCGAIHTSRDIGVMFRAFEKLNHQNPNTIFVLTGRKKKGLRLPQRVQWLGYVPYGQVPVVMNSLDVLIVTNQLSDFGKYSYPVKLYEAMKCQIPVVATNTPPAYWILSGRTQFLAKPADDIDLAKKVQSLLDMGRFDYGDLNTWERSSRVFEKILLTYHDTKKCLK